MEGKRISFEYDGQSMEGLVIQVKGGEANIKLDSGYNIVVREKDLKDVKELEKEDSPEAGPTPVEEKPGLPTISILHTGGTIASKVDYETGGVHTHFTPEDIVAMFPELKGLANVKSRLVRNMWSGDMRFEHYNILAEEVKKEAEAGAHGVIITHGTDTMHYTSAALTFMLDPLPIPVVLTGAARSSDRGSSDGGMNLFCAASAICKTDFGGVAICMHATTDDETCWLHDGLHVRKMHSSRRDGFQPVNKKPWATISAEGKVTWLRNDWPKRSKGKVDFTSMKDVNVGMLYQHPHMRAADVEHFKDHDGLVVVGTGLGHMSVDDLDEFTKENAKILDAVKSLDIPVVMTTQCIYGPIQMDVYSYGRKLQEEGVLGNQTTIQPETAFIKMAWLLSQGKDVKDNWNENIRGEIADVSPLEDLHAS